MRIENYNCAKLVPSGISLKVEDPIVPRTVSEITPVLTSVESASSKRKKPELDVGWGDWSAMRVGTTWDVPPAPSPVYFDETKQTSIKAMFNSQGDGGTPVLEWQLNWALTADGGPDVTPSQGTSIILNLLAGRTYFFKARGRNAVGWGAWSPLRTATLIAGALVNVASVWKRAVPYVKEGGVWKMARPYVKVAGVWKETL